MKLVVGLGNPGPRYAATRHNVGFRILAVLAQRAGALLEAGRFQAWSGSAVLAGEPALLLAPQTYMNLSGESVAAALDAHPEIEVARDLIVAYDDLDLPFGRLRLRPSGGAGGHRGMESLAEQIQRTDFVRLRFGIDRPVEGTDPVDWVLQPFARDEERQLPALLVRAADAVEAVIRDGADAAMSEFNRATEDP